MGQLVQPQDYRTGARDIGGALTDQIPHKRIDHAPDGLVNQAPSRDVRVMTFRHRQMPCEYFDLRKLLLGDQAGAQAVVYVVVVVGNFIG